MRSNITTYRLYLISEALRNLDLQLLLEPIVKKLIRYDAVPYGIQRVGDYVEIGFKNPTADIRRTLEEISFNQQRMDIHLLKEEDSMVLINIAGCQFQEEDDTIQEYLRDAGKIVNYYRQTKKYAGHQIETGVITFWFRTLDHDLEKKIDKRRRMFFNNEKYEEMRGRKKKNEAESTPKDNSKATLKKTPAVGLTSKEAESEAAMEVGKPNLANKSCGTVKPAISVSDAASMDVDDPRVKKRKAEELEEQQRRQKEVDIITAQNRKNIRERLAKEEKDNIRFERDRRMMEKIEKAKETLQKKPKTYEGADST